MKAKAWMMAAAVAAMGLTAPAAKADLVIQGRAAQALHCSAMLFMVSSELRDAGYISARDADVAQTAAIRMLAYVPGSDAEKLQAMKQRFARILNSRTMPQLFAEYDTTSKWCRKNFL